MFQDKDRGKKNKLNIGDKVRAKPQWAEWHCKYLSWSFGKRVSGDLSYCEGEKEIPLEDMDKVYAFTNAYLGGKMPLGIVSHYGARDNDNKVDRKNVYVNFTFDTELGKIEYGCYVNEKDLDFLKIKSKRQPGR